MTDRKVAVSYTLRSGDGLRRGLKNVAGRLNRPLPWLAIAGCALTYLPGCTTLRTNAHAGRTSALFESGRCGISPPDRVTRAVDPPPEELARAARRARESVVEVRACFRPPDATCGVDDPRIAYTTLHFGGSGVIVGSEGIILTNEHVVRGAAGLTVVTADGQEWPASLAGTADYLDLAVLRIDAARLPALSLGWTVPEAGGAVAALSAPNQHDGPAVRYGVVVRPTVSLQDDLDPAGWRDYQQLVESTTALDRGFSGGPLLDSAGDIVGVNVAARGRPDNAAARGYAIRIDGRTRRVIQSLVSTARGSSKDRAQQ